MPATATAPPRLSGPLSAVLTAEAEACCCATAPGDLCTECQARSESAAACRVLADDLGLLIQA